MAILNKMGIFRDALSKVVGNSVFAGQPMERLVVSPVRGKPYKADFMDVYP